MWDAYTDSFMYRISNGGLSRQPAMLRGLPASFQAAVRGEGTWLQMEEADSNPACPPPAFWALSPVPTPSLSLSCCLFQKTAQVPPSEPNPSLLPLHLPASAPFSRGLPLLDPSLPPQGSRIVLTP